MYKINDLLNEAGKSNARSRLYRSDSTAISKKELVVYESRYKTFLKAINDIDLSSYSEDKRSGFNQCLDKYLKVANNNTKDLDVIYDSLNKDLDECQNKINENNDSFLIGYRDCLKVIDYFLKESKKAFFKKLVDNIK